METRIDLIQRAQRLAAREAAFRLGIEELMTYLLSDKFHADPTVQVADVLRRITHAQNMANDAEWQASEEQKAA